MATGLPDDFEANIDRIIRDSIEGGDFEDLPGKGKPIPGVGTKDDAHWWVREWLKQNPTQTDDDDRAGAK